MKNLEEYALGGILKEGEQRREGAMKKMAAVVLVAAWLAAGTSPVWAEAGMEKLKEGAKTFVMSPKNVVDSVKEEYEAADFKPFGVFGGLFKGLALTVKDAATGLVDVLTFPVE